MKTEHLPMRRGAMLLLLAAALAAACSSFDLINVWRAPEFKGPAMQKVLVVGLARSDASRRIFEDGFAQALAANGVSASAAYISVPDTGQISEERVKAAVKQTGSDSILITRVLSVEQKTDVVQPSGGYYHRGGYYGFYGSAWSMAPAYTNTYNVLRIETTLWDVRGDTMIWSGVTQAIQPSNMDKATADMAKVLIEQMRKDGVI